MPRWRLPLSILLAILSIEQVSAATLVTLRFYNSSKFQDLNWVGESIPETLSGEFSQAGEIVLNRNARLDGLHQLSLREDVQLTKGTLIKLGQTLDVDYICYGTYSATLPSPTSQLKSGSIQITATYIDLRKMHAGPTLTEAGPLANLSQMEEHLAWQLLNNISPESKLSVDKFIQPQKLVKVDSKESFIRGLLASDRDQKSKWFTQSIQLDPNFSSPAIALGDLAMDRKDYPLAISCLKRVPDSDARYPEARFKLGLSAYSSGQYKDAVGYFREVVKAVPLNEVYNNLGVAEDALAQPVALDDFRHALDGDQNDPVYLFNISRALLRNNYFDEAVRHLQLLVDRNPGDREGHRLLDRAKLRQISPAELTAAPSRLKLNFDEVAYLQLKAMLQPGVKK